MEEYVHKHSPLVRYNGSCISQNTQCSVVVFYRFEVSEVDVVERWDRGGKKTSSLVVLCVKSRDLKFVRRDLGLPPSLNELHHHITVLST